MRKALIDSGRFVGLVNVDRSVTGIIEYGHRDKDDILHTVGHARLTPISKLPASFQSLIRNDFYALWDC